MTRNKNKLRGNRTPQAKTRSSDEWGECEVCGQTLPLCAETGMCYPCTTGEASTIYGLDDD